MTPIRKGTAARLAAWRREMHREATEGFRAVFLAALDAPHPTVRWGARLIVAVWVYGVLSWMWFLLGAFAWWV